MIASWSFKPCRYRTPSVSQSRAWSRMMASEHLDSETGLAPVPPLGVVPKSILSVLLSPGCSSLQERREIALCLPSPPRAGLVSYLMVLPVLRRIHWGIGRFCFCALASFCLVRKVLLLYCTLSSAPVSLKSSKLRLSSLNCPSPSVPADFAVA